METDHVSVHQRAWIAVDALQPSERDTLFQTLERLSTLPPAEWPQPGPRLLKPESALYSLRVTPDLHVFFSVTGPNHLEIEDLVRPETLELHFRPRVEKGKAV
ncbi:MAG TPA: hypothetical protein VEL76_00315 [Gemmataceae bacterium]|nr:hypothetical protein [Gemmataceae bacterium]